MSANLVMLASVTFILYFYIDRNIVSRRWDDVPPCLAAKIANVLYTTEVSRLFLVAVVVLLLGDASGVLAFVTPETCTSASDTQPDGKCPSLCVRCACCVPPIVPTATAVTTTNGLCAPPADLKPLFLALGSPHDILHVPK